MGAAVGDRRAIDGGPSARMVCFVNPSCLNTAVEDADYLAVLQDADLVLADGIGVRMAARLRGIALRDNVNGTDLFPRLCRRARRLDLPLLKQALTTTTKLSSFVMFILVGATIFSMVFQAADGPVWVEHLLAKLPGGQLGFLIFVNVMIFVLAFFLDFFELSFIVVPVLAPIADKMGIDLVWFGVLLAMNMQTSFMHPPFGFALFYLRSVAPDKPYVDAHTGKTMEPVTTMQIYKGAIPFLLLQLVMVGMLIAFPALVTGGLDKQVKVDMDAVGEQMMKDLNQEAGGAADAGPEPSPLDSATPAGGAAPVPGASDAPANGSGLPGIGDSSHSGGPAGGEPDDPMKAIQNAIGK